MSGHANHPRQRFGDLALGAHATIAGRVVARLAGERAFVLRDASGEARLFVPAGATAPAVGSLVVVEGFRTKEGFTSVKLEVVGVAALRPGELGEWDAANAAESALRRRAVIERDRLLHALRSYFRGEQFLEATTPTLLSAPGQEPYLKPFETAFHGFGAPQRLWLATSPEYALKRLLAAGHERLFEITKSFRDGRDEHSPLHAPEFTLLEWYRAWEGLDAIGRDVEALLRAAADALAPSRSLARGGLACDVGRAAHWLPVAQAFRELAELSLEPYLDGDDAAFVRSLPAAIPRVGDSAREQADSAYFRLLIERIEPRLGVGAPTFLCRYPARHAALSELAKDDPRVAERFEAYVLGVELSNAFLELRDPAEQERRLRAEQQERVAAGGEALPVNEPFLRALRSGLPPCAGIALGVDRLQLLVVGAERLDDVLPFSFAADR